MKVTTGHNVSVHYVGTFTDGTEFDNSRTRGQPLSFTVGSENMIRGFDNAIVGMTTGETKSFTLTSNEAYGQRDPTAVQEVPRSSFETGFEFEVNAMIRGQTPNGPFLAKIQSLQDDTVTLDFNHPLAGRDLNFEVELVAVDAATATADWSPSMKKAELFEVAKTRGIEVNSRTTKAQLVAALSA